VRLVIENFICIKKAEVQFSEYTVFIGEQASGKSLISKLYFFLRDSVSTSIVSTIPKKGWDDFKLEILEKFDSIFPEYSWRNTSFSVKMLNESNLEVIKILHKKGRKSVELIFSPQFRTDYDTIKNLYEVAKKSNKNTFEYFERDFMSIDLLSRAYKKLKNKDFMEDVTYIPSGRSFFSVIRDNVFGFLSENIGIDPFLKSFGRFYEFSKRINLARRVNRKDLQKFDELSYFVLKGEFQTEKNDDWIMANDRKVLVSNSSSGQQEALPLMLGLRALLISKSVLGVRSVIVEEPEAHLFPDSQKSIIEAIFLANDLGMNSKFLITTHSPYILSCINNQLIKRQNAKDSVTKNVSIAAYFLSGGNVTSILDAETGLINGNALDSVSDSLAKEFYDILGNL
jgi:predicted ATPase